VELHILPESKSDPQKIFPNCHPGNTVRIPAEFLVLHDGKVSCSTREILFLLNVEETAASNFLPASPPHFGLK
jgi:hypothetical protein